MGRKSLKGSGRSPGEGNGNPLQYSCLENSTDRGAWRATVHGVTEGRKLLERFSTCKVSLGCQPPAEHMNQVGVHLWLFLRHLGLSNGLFVLQTGFSLNPSFFSLLSPVPRSWKSWEGPSPGDSGRTSALGPLDLRRLVHRIQTAGLSCVPLCGIFLVCFFITSQTLSPYTDTNPPHTKLNSMKPRTWFIPVLFPKEGLAQSPN